MSQPQPPRPSYPKPWLSYADQIALLSSRGLVIANVPDATDFLRRVGYYRFSGYCLAFEKSRHAFWPSVTFEQVRATYEFDLALRDVVTEALEVVEVDFRTTVAYHLGGKYGAFGHTAPANFFSQFNHAVWITKLHDETCRSSELFVTHFKATYAEFPDLPIWVVTELMSFGSLSQMFSGLLKIDKKAIALPYGLQPDVLGSWLHHMTYVRNLCAHHSRLWDRVWSIKPRLPYGHAWQPPFVPGNNRMLATLLILNYLMGRSPAVTGFAADWRRRVESLIDQSPTVPSSARMMGLTTTWKTHPLWK